jgi:hypothetical protein
MPRHLTNAQSKLRAEPETEPEKLRMFSASEAKRSLAMKREVLAKPVVAAFQKVIEQRKKRGYTSVKVCFKVAPVLDSQVAAEEAMKPAWLMPSWAPGEIDCALFQKEISPRLEACGYKVKAGGSIVWSPASPPKVGHGGQICLGQELRSLQISWSETLVQKHRDAVLDEILDKISEGVKLRVDEGFGSLSLTKTPLGKLLKGTFFVTTETNYSDEIVIVDEKVLESVLIPLLKDAGYAAEVAGSGSGIKLVISWE